MMFKNKLLYKFFALFLIILHFFCINIVSNLRLIEVNSNKICAYASSGKFNYNNKQKEITSAKAMATMEVSTGRILFNKNENEKLPMASTTKIITAIVAIENCKNLDKKHEIPRESVGIEGSSIYLRQNEHLSVRELLYGLMLRSGNDSAVAIAIIVGGSVENFVKMMNEFCVKLKMNNTNIVTVNGLHDSKHYTTAADLAVASCYALKNKTFREIVSTKNANIGDDNAKNDIRYLKNKNKLLWKLDGATGVKTGYTKKAGRCFVGSAKRNGMEIVCVVLDCNLMFEECANLINKAFDEFLMAKIFSKGVVFYSKVKTKKGYKDIPIVLTSDIYYPISKKDFQKEFSEIKASTEILDNLKLPLSYKNEIGKLEIKFKNNLIFSEKLFTINADENEEESFFRKIIKAF